MGRLRRVDYPSYLREPKNYYLLNKSGFILGRVRQKPVTGKRRGRVGGGVLSANISNLADFFARCANLRAKKCKILPKRGWIILQLKIENSKVSGIFFENVVHNNLQMTKTKKVHKFVVKGLKKAQK